MAPKINKNHILKSVFISVIVSLVISTMVGYFVYRKLITPLTQNELISEFYRVENAVYVSPHSLRKSMDKGDTNYILVDLRSSQEYAKKHIVGAINIPAYKDPDTSDYGAVDRIVSSFRDLPKGKDIIVYCYSMPCMTGRKIGLLLAQHGIFVKHLGIGWNEWRYFWNLWNHEHELDRVNPEEYVSEGTQAGTLQKRELNPLSPCSRDDQFGC